MGLSHPAGERRGCAAARGWRQPAGEARHDGGEDAEQHLERPGEFEAARERSAPAHTPTGGIARKLWDSLSTAQRAPTRACSADGPACYGVLPFPPRSRAVLCRESMSDDESDSAPLDDRLLDGLSGLEFLLSASLMPDDFDLEALASCDASAIAQCEVCPDIQDRVFGLMARALLVFAEAEASGALGPGEYGLDSQELHGQFVAMLEAETEKVLRTRGWADPAEFQAALRDALAVGGGSGGAGGEEGRRVRRGAAAAELLELLDGMSRFEPWAEAMKRLGRELLEMRGAG